MPGPSERALVGGDDRRRRLAAQADGGRAGLLLDLPEPRLPAPVEAGERLVAARRGQVAQVAEQRRHVLDVEHGDADRLVALEQQVARVVAQAGEAAAGRVGGRVDVEAVLLRAGDELVEQLVAGPGAVAQRRRGLAADALGQALPVRAELPRRGVQLAERPVLGAVEAVTRDLHVSDSAPAPTAARRRRWPRGRG